MANNPLAPFSYPGAPGSPLAASPWSIVKAIFEGSIALTFDVGYPANLRLTLTFGGMPMSATGVDNVGELIEGFQLGEEATVVCDRAGFSLVQIGDVVVYRDAVTEVSIPRGEYDRLSVLVSELFRNESVNATFQEIYLWLARDARTAAWNPARTDL